MTTVMTPTLAQRPLAPVKQEPGTVAVAPTMVQCPTSGAMVSGAMVSGSMVSGSMVSGSMVSGAMVSGAMMQGTPMSGGQTVQTVALGPGGQLVLGSQVPTGSCAPQLLLSLLSSPSQTVPPPRV